MIYHCFLPSEYGSWDPPKYAIETEADPNDEKEQKSKKCPWVLVGLDLTEMRRGRANGWALQCGQKPRHSLCKAETKQPLAPHKIPQTMGAKEITMTRSVSYV